MSLGSNKPATLFPHLGNVTLIPKKSQTERDIIMILESNGKHSIQSMLDECLNHEQLLSGYLKKKKDKEIGVKLQTH